jgi:hypothetical protein
MQSILEFSYCIICLIRDFIQKYAKFATIVIEKKLLACLNVTTRQSAGVKVNVSIVCWVEDVSCPTNFIHNRFRDGVGGGVSFCHRQIMSYLIACITPVVDESMECGVRVNVNATLFSRNRTMD